MAPGGVRVNFYAVNLRHYLIQRKLADPSFCKPFVDRILLGEVMMEIMQKYPDNIEQLLSIRSYIDGEFESHTF